MHNYRERALTNSQHMNLVLADTEEFRRIKRRQNKSSAPGASGGNETVETEEKRTLGLTIVRGAHIISLSVESPPPADPSARLNKTTQGGISSALGAGPGVAKPAGRGAPPPSLAVCPPSPTSVLMTNHSQGPAAGVGGGAPGFAPPSFPGAPPGFPGPGGRGGKSNYLRCLPATSNSFQAPPPGFGGGNFPPGGFPGGAPPGFGGGPPGGPPGFQPPPRR